MPESEAVRMADRVRIDGMADAITRALEEYGSLTAEAVKNAVTRAADSVKKDLQATSPKDTGKYAKSWTAKKVSETRDSISVTVHSKGQYQLTHLLEFGHAKRNGGRVAARPHIGRAEEKLDETLTREIEKELEGKA